jgi:type II secretory pathway component PulK
MILLAAGAAVVAVLLVAAVAVALARDARADERLSTAWRDEHTRDRRDDG